MQVLMAAISYDDLRANGGNALWLLFQLRNGVDGAWISAMPPTGMTRLYCGCSSMGGNPIQYECEREIESERERERERECVCMC